MSRPYWERAKALAKGHHCDKYCGLAEDIEHELERVAAQERAQALEEAAQLATAHRRLGCGCDLRCSDKCLGKDDGHEEAASDIAYRIRALAAREAQPAAVSSSAAPAKCEGCGLHHGTSYPNEPSVRVRLDGHVRCNDCACPAGQKASGR